MEQVIFRPDRISHLLVDLDSVFSVYEMQILKFSHACIICVTSELPHNLLISRSLELPEPGKHTVLL